MDLMGNRRVAILLMLVFLVSGLILVGCGQSEDPADAGDQAPVEQKITYNLGVEPETLDPAAASGAPEGTVQLALFEGLTRLDADNQPIAGMAEKWDVSEDGLKYTFYLRDAKWSNGDPVTASDFEYAWKRLMNPELANYYAYQGYYLLNGEEYNSKKAKAEDVGVQAVDAKTLEVTLKAPTPYFLSLMAFPTFYPVNQKVDEADKNWHTAAETYVGNGPFKLVEWEHNQKLVLTKNENYWAADDVKLETIVMTMVESHDTALTMFDTDEVDIVEEIPLQEMSRLISENKALVSPDLGVYFYVFNTDKKPLDDVRVRKAMALSIDRQNLIDNVTQAFQKPAFAMVPFGVNDNGAD
ncbi:MAG: peptide ABC transporter substrate-binding protein, partial [Desulfitobacteriaceae bacterium]|nr:peptide ABC transporter substrate-binding protein [Desulfitobacteriaceae bacterium]